MDPPQTTTTPTTSGGDDDDIGPKDPTTIVKGKRTKRQRPTNVTHSSASYNAFNSSPASSSNFPAGSATTEEEDTANCLILLSKGHDVSPTNYNNNNNNNTDDLSGYKFNSKRFIQTSTDPLNGSTGMYVYECKTCSRTFSSFQALGGHRASHKKPRNNELDTRKPPRYAVVSEEDELSSRFESQKNNFSSSSSLSLQLNQRMVSCYNTKKPSSKLHDCSICGAEFNSGQALGGHMRRHRSVNGHNGNASTAISAGVTATNTTLSLVPYNPITSVVADDQENQKSMNDGLCLDLDLNLPAPPEMSVADSDQDQRRESSFKFSANQNKQQPTVRLSATPTLVDCHY